MAFVIINNYRLYIIILFYNITTKNKIALIYFLFYFKYFFSFKKLRFFSFLTIMR